MSLCKESLNSDGQQFYQYQQNKQSPLILTHGRKKGGLRRVKFKIQVLAQIKVEHINKTAKKKTASLQ